MLNLPIFRVIMTMGMCFQNRAKTLFLSVFCIFLSIIFDGCEAFDTILPSAGNYKLNIRVNDIPLDECSFVTSLDINNIFPLFEESVSDDKDVTGLMVFIRNSKGNVIGRKVTYSLNDDLSSSDSYTGERSTGSLNGDEVIILVNDMDDIFPSFPVSADLSMGMYTIVSQVMNGRNILQKTEKTFYYLGAADFLYKGINVYFPGIAASPQLIPKGVIVMLEAGLDFSENLDPYIIWYEGRRKIHEGKFSDGAGQLFWKAPDQSGFFSLRAEVFPVMDFEKLAGYNKEISLLVPSNKEIDMHLVSDNVPHLIHWYTFESNLNDLKSAHLSEHTEPSAKIPSFHSVKWMGADGTYGPATGSNNIINLLNVLLPSNNAIKTWQVLFRFKPMNDGEIFSVLFDSSRYALRLSMEGRNIVLTLTSPVSAVSQVFYLPENAEGEDEDSSETELSFITAGVVFSVTQDSLSAQINIADDSAGSDPIALNVKIDEGFHVLLGSLPESSAVNNTALWDEFALYFFDVLIAEARLPAKEGLQTASAGNL